MALPAEIPPPALHLFEFPVWGLPLEDYVALAQARIEAKRPTLFSTINAHAAVTATKSPAFAAHFKTADLVLPDGILPVWAGKALGATMSGRVSGTLFSEALLSVAEREGYRVAFVGTTDDTLAKMRKALELRWPKLHIALMLAPPFGDWDQAYNKSLLAHIARSGADILFVGMTAPKQELWLSRNHAEIAAPFRIGVGGFFDTLAGNKHPAPQLVGELGLEWLFRLVQDPARMWRRNLDSAVFLGLFARQWMHSHKS